MKTSERAILDTPATCCGQAQDVAQCASLDEVAATVGAPYIYSTTRAMANRKPVRYNYFLSALLNVLDDEGDMATLGPFYNVLDTLRR